MAKDNRNKPIKTGRGPRRGSRTPPAVGASPRKGCDFTVITIPYHVIRYYWNGGKPCQTASVY